jgi:GT2 family glycosyltransferase
MLIDDASSDGTTEMVGNHFPSVDVTTLSSPGGAVARNVGIRTRTEPYLAFCDDDAWFMPGALRRAVTLLDDHPRLALVNPRILVGPERRMDPVCEEMTASPLPPAPGQPGRPLLSFIACAVVLRRDAALEAGGFCERLEIGAEEKLLGWDLAAAGWQMSYVPDIIARHCPPPADGRLRRRAQTLRNDLWINWLRRPPAAAAKATLRHLRRTGHDRAALPGLADAACGAPWVLRERRRCPARVEEMISLLEDAAR